MPKVFRPKIVHPTTKSVPKETPPCTSVGDTRLPRSPSPTNSSVLAKPKTETPKTPSNNAPIVPPDSLQLNATAVDIDQATPIKPLTPVPDIQVDLFSTKHVKRSHSKHFSEPPPDPDKPLDRSTVSLRSLLNWTPVNKPPPTYRQNRSTTSTSSSIQSSSVGEKPEPSPVKPFVPSLPSDTTPGPQPDLLAPQLRLDADGNIVLDETSLLVSLPETTSNTKGIRFVDEESGLLSVTYNSFRRPPEKHGGRWDARETVRFYRALSTIGPDFYLMMKLFPNRNRGELKRKFKRESRTHPYLVNQALRNRRTYDLTALVALSDEEEETSEDKKDVKAKIETKPIVKNKHKRQKSPPVKKQGPEKKPKNYDPNKVLETIDSVLAQTASEDFEPSTVEQPASGKTSRVLDRMIAYKQREVELTECQLIPVLTAPMFNQIASSEPSFNLGSGDVQLIPVFTLPNSIMVHQPESSETHRILTDQTHDLELAERPLIQVVSAPEPTTVHQPESTETSRVHPDIPTDKPCDLDLNETLPIQNVTASVSATVDQPVSSETADDLTRMIPDKPREVESTEPQIVAAVPCSEPTVLNESPSCKTIQVRTRRSTRTQRQLAIQQSDLAQSQVVPAVLTIPAELWPTS